jgi:hypothetical protein
MSVFVRHRCMCTVLLACFSTAVYCQLSICLFDQEHQTGNCVVCWAIVTYLDVRVRIVKCDVFCAYM